jgi:hypothetical protein
MRSGGLSIRRNDTGELVKSLKHKTLLERLAGYFRGKESKSYPSDGYGLLARKHVNVVEHVYIGKESRDSKESLLEETSDIIGHYTDSDTPEYSRTGVAGLVATVGAAALARRTGIPRRTLNDSKHGAKPSGRTRRAILARMRPESVDNGPEPLCDKVCERIRAYGPARLARESKVGVLLLFTTLNHRHHPLKRSHSRSDTVQHVVDSPPPP